MTQILYKCILFLFTFNIFANNRPSLQCATVLSTTTGFFIKWNIGTVKGKNGETDHEGDFHNLNTLVFKPEALGRSINLELSRIIRPDMV